MVSPRTSLSNSSVASKESLDGLIMDGEGGRHELKGWDLADYGS